jgi:CheY-specific phosphatase CheX
MVGNKFQEGVFHMVEMNTYRKNVVLAAVLGTVAGGIVVALVMRAIPKMMSQMMAGMMKNMMAQKGENGFAPPDI